MTNLNNQDSHHHHPHEHEREHARPGVTLRKMTGHQKLAAYCGSLLVVAITLAAITLCALLVHWGFIHLQ